jgi:hypothetical protein
MVELNRHCIGKSARAVAVRDASRFGRLACRTTRLSHAKPQAVNEIIQADDAPLQRFPYIEADY